MATKLKASGTRNYQSRSGKSTISSNRMSAHQTPSRSQSIASTRTAPSGYRVGTRNSLRAGSAAAKVYSRNSSGKKITQGTVVQYGRKEVRFQAPKSMPSKLNNAAASSVASRRYTTAAFLAPTPHTIVLAAGLSKVTSVRNNFATTRLKAAGYKVKGTGVKGKIVKTSARQQARAQKRLVRQESRSRTIYKASNKGIIVVPTRKNARTNKNTNKNYQKRQKAKAQKRSNRRFRVRRDGRGRFAGSY